VREDFSMESHRQKATEVEIIVEIYELGLKVKLTFFGD